MKLNCIQFHLGAGNTIDSVSSVEVIPRSGEVVSISNKHYIVNNVGYNYDDGVVIVLVERWR